MVRRYVAFRLDEEYYQLILSLSIVTGMSVSEVIRAMIRIATALLDPDVRVRDVLREHYVRELERCNKAVLDVPFIDALSTRLPTLESFFNNGNERSRKKH